MSILIVRHGETKDNRNRIIQMPSTPLSNDGNQQAKLLAKRLAKRNISQVLCSDYLRTQQTAAHFSALTNIEITFESNLRERHFGDIRGQSYDEVGTNPFVPEYVPPNGESLAVFLNRVSTAWSKITKAAESLDGDLLVVTHGLVCRAILKQHLYCPATIKSRSEFGNTCLTEVENCQPWTVQLLNCTAHLTPI